MKGSINKILRKRRESWPHDNISGRGRLSLARRNIVIPGISDRISYEGSHEEPAPTARERGDK